MYNKLPPDQQYLARLKRDNPDKHREISSLGGIALNAKTDHNRAALIKARAAQKIKRAERRAAREAAAAAAQNGGA